MEVDRRVARDDSKRFKAEPGTGPRPRERLESQTGEENRGKRLEANLISSWNRFAACKCRLPALIGPPALPPAFLLRPFFSSSLLGPSQHLRHPCCALFILRICESEWQPLAHDDDLFPG